MIDRIEMDVFNYKVLIENDKCVINSKICILENDDIDNIISTVINKYGNINLFSGDSGKIENSDRYYFKLWIRHPYDFDIKLDVTMDEYKFDGLDVGLSNDYDDTGRLYIKFICDEIKVIKVDK